MANPFNRTNKAIADAVSKVISRQKMDILAKRAAKQIRKRTRLGKGVDRSGGTQKNLKPLADSYKAQRRGEVTFITRKLPSGASIVVPIRRNIRRPRLDSTTSPARSNLTFSGKMLRAIIGRGLGAGKALVTMNPRRIGDRLSNVQIAKLVSQQRPFFHLTRGELNGINRRLRREIIDLANINLTRVR